MTTTKPAIEFGNPRLRAEFDNWPSGGKRVPCVFQVHHDKRGYRISKTTTGKPKYTTYSGQCAIVDGSDGKIYLLQVAQDFGFIKIMRHDFLDATGDIGRQASVFDRDEAELHAALSALILRGGSINMPRE